MAFRIAADHPGNRWAEPLAYGVVGWPSIFGRLAALASPSLAWLLRLVGEFDRQALGHVRRHLRDDIRHLPRIDLRRPLRARTLLSRPLKIFAASRGFMFSYMVTRPLSCAFRRRPSACVSTLIWDSTCFEFGELGVHALFGALDQAFADVEFAGAGVEFLAPLLQSLEDGALGAGRQRGAVGRDHRAAGRQCAACRLGRAAASRRRLRSGALLAFAGSVCSPSRLCPGYRLRVGESRPARLRRRATAPATTPLPSGKLNICCAHDKRRSGRRRRVGHRANDRNVAVGRPAHCRPRKARSHADARSAILSVNRHALAISAIGMSRRSRM